MCGDFESIFKFMLSSLAKIMDTYIKSHKSVTLLTVEENFNTTVILSIDHLSETIVIFSAIIVWLHTKHVT